MQKTIKYFTINVFGPKAKEVEVGFLAKETGWPRGETDKVLLDPGVISIPNYSEIWGKKKALVGGKLTGDFTPMKWGQEGGVIIRVRYIKSSQSLDMDYQIEKGLKLPDDMAEISLRNGLNEFDELKDQGLISMLKIHSYNKSNESRNPDAPGIFEEYNGEARSAKKKIKATTRREAEDIVNAVEGDSDGLSVLAAILGEDPQQQDDILFGILFDKTQDNPDQFMEVINDKKERFRTALTFAHEKEIIAGENGGQTTIRDLKTDKLSPLFQDNGIQEFDDVVEYLAENFLKSDVHDAIVRIEKVVDDYKELAYN